MLDQFTTRLEKRREQNPIHRNPISLMRDWLGASWEGPGAYLEGLRAKYEGSGASWEGPGASWEGPGVR